MIMMCDEWLWENNNKRLHLLDLPVVVVGSVETVVGSDVVTSASSMHRMMHSAPMSFFFLFVLNLTIMSPSYFWVLNFVFLNLV